MKTISAITRRPAFWQVDPARTKAMPFPGRYPTRWHLIFLSAPKKVLWQYEGKPNKLIIPKVESFLKKHGTMWLCEYDRGGCFRYTWQSTPRKMPFNVYGLNSLAAWYYPWAKEGSGSEFFRAWRYGVQHKMILSQGKKFFVYSTIKEMLMGESNIQLLREYRTWLRKVDPLK